jgi:hypothetical protein
MKPLFTLISLLLATTLSGQDIVGTWQWTAEDKEGEEQAAILEFEEDLTLTMDLGADGTVEFESDYMYTDGRLFIRSTNEEDACAGMEGVYAFELEGDMAFMELVSDECEIRKDAAASMGTMMRLDH